MDLIEKMNEVKQLEGRVKLLQDQLRIKEEDENKKVLDAVEREKLLKKSEDDIKKRLESLSSRTHVMHGWGANIYL